MIAVQFEALTEASGIQPELQSPDSDVQTRVDPVWPGIFAIVMAVLLPPIGILLSYIGVCAHRQGTRSYKLYLWSLGISVAIALLLELSLGLLYALAMSFH